MIRLSSDSLVAERQISAILFLLIAFGYIDGDFDETERKFVDRYLDALIHALVSTFPPDKRAAHGARYRKRYAKAVAKIDAHVETLLTEPIAEGQKRADFVGSRLKLRVFEIFERFDQEMQHSLLEGVEALIAADGRIDPAEAAFRDEIRALLKVAEPQSPVGHRYAPRTSMSLLPAKTLKHHTRSHPILDAVEQHYAQDPEILAGQAASDRALIEQAITLLWGQREQGNGRLEGKVQISQVGRSAAFLDDFIYAMAPQPDEQYEICVLGDLHGCYSCLKAALLQFDFFHKVEAWRRNPKGSPCPKLVFLGDYIDRGLLSLEGVMRGALSLYVNFPEHVYLLRGNHEWYVERGGSVMSGVRPSEAITSWVDRMPRDHFKSYVRLFDNLPAMFLFGETLFVHGGIPRDDVLDNYEDLTFLNDPYVRFQMMWSDPSEAEHVPLALQKDGARFPFGRRQFRRFMEQIGASTLIRGHEKVREGFALSIDDGPLKLLTVFSAGGSGSHDLPPRSPYRKVTPMAMTVSWGPDGLAGYPWEIDYQPFNLPENNGFLRYTR